MVQDQVKYHVYNAPCALPCLCGLLYTIDMVSVSSLYNDISSCTPAKLMTYVLLRLQPANMILQIREVAKLRPQTLPFRSDFTSSIVGLKTTGAGRSGKKWTMCPMCDLCDPRAASISLETYSLWKLQILYPLSVFVCNRGCARFPHRPTPFSHSLSVYLLLVRMPPMLPHTSSKAGVHASNVATNF